MFIFGLGEPSSIPGRDSLLSLSCKYPWKMHGFIRCPLPTDEPTGFSRPVGRKTDTRRRKAPN